MDYYKEIKNRLIDNEAYCRVKDYSKERNTIITYFEIGKLLDKAKGEYGDHIIEEYSHKLVLEVGKKYTRSNLFRMRQLYIVFSNQKVAPLVRQLTWTHCLILMPLKDIDEIYYYAYQTINNRLSKRQLLTIVKNNEYKRLPIKSINKLVNRQNQKIEDFVPNPILIKNKNKVSIITEKELHLLILEDIELFLRELGNGFCFIGSEYRIKIGEAYNYIDILLFNIDFNCYVVVELKVTELKKEHIGQIEVYMNYIDDNLRTPIQGKTIGIIICKQDNKYVIKYCSDSRIISREYKLI